MRLDAIKGDLMRDVVLLDKLREKEFGTQRYTGHLYFGGGNGDVWMPQKATTKADAAVLEEGSNLALLGKTGFMI